MTDNGSAYVSAAHALACRALGIKHIRTRPYRPQTNGKAERFIRTMLARVGLRRRLRLLAEERPRLSLAGSSATTPPTTRRPRPPTAHSRLRELTGNNVAGIYN